MSPPETAKLAQGLPTDPVFAEPWQAQAFAMVVALHQRGLFTWSEWAQALADELKAHGAHDDGSHYYEHWVGALESLLLKQQTTTAGDVEALAASWMRAAEATPHGRPIELKNDPLE